MATALATFVLVEVAVPEGDVKFTVKGITTYSRGEDGEYGMNPKIFTVTKDAGSIYSEYNGMNVTKWGPTCITLYTFDMLGKKSVGRINYKDITILNETKDIPGFEGTLEALNELTIIK